MSTNGFEDLAYRELQGACKALGLNAKGAKEELAARLQEAGWQPGQPLPQVSGFTPSASRSARAAGVTGRADSGELVEQTPPTAHLLQTASKTPLPRTPPREDSPKPSPRRLRRARSGSSLSLGRLLLAAAAVAALSAVALPAWQHLGLGDQLRQQFPGPMQRVDDAVGAAATLASQLHARALAAVPEPAQQQAAAGLAWAQHSWQEAHRQCAYALGVGQQWLAEKLQKQAQPQPDNAQAEPAAAEPEQAAAEPQPVAEPEPQPEPAALASEPEQAVAEPEPATSEQAVAAAEPEPEPEPAVQTSEGGEAEPAAAAAPSAQEAVLDTEVGKPLAAEARCDGRLNPEAVDGIVQPGEMWENLKQTARAAFQGQRVDTTKATTMLFACVDQNCPGISDWLRWGTPEGCLLKLDAAGLGTDRGALQKTLADFISKEPKGTVLISNIEKLSPELVPTLINAVAEMGAFEQDGRPVITGAANFLLTLEVPRAILESESEAVFKVKSKAHLVQALATSDENLGPAQALRRRIELVLPTIH